MFVQYAECVVYTESCNVFVCNVNPQIHFRFSNTICLGPLCENACVWGTKTRMTQTVQYKFACIQSHRFTYGIIFSLKMVTLTTIDSLPGERICSEAVCCLCLCVCLCIAMAQTHSTQTNAHYNPAWLAHSQTVHSKCA